MYHTEFYRGFERAQQVLAGLRTNAHRSDSPPPARAKAALVHAAVQPMLDQADDSPRACDRGCAHCCHFPVGITFAEAEHLAEAVAASPTHQERVLTASNNENGLAWTDLVGVPCPLLEAGACGCYEARPLPCRALASADATACAGALTGHGMVPRDDVAFARGLGAAAALAADGPTTGTRELRSALAAVLTAAPEDRAAAFDQALPPPA